jgi:hypothetical protein
MKEYKLDTNTHMGAWYIPKRLCDKIIKKMNNSNLKPGIMYRQGQEKVKVWHCENDFKSMLNYDRCLVFMTYLNDVEDGGTSFKYQNIDMPAQKGLTVMWPAYWTHMHKGIVSDTKEKYIATGWLNYIEHRQMLIDQGKVDWSWELGSTQ